MKPEQINQLLKEDAKILWHERKLQQGRDLWNAMKMTARSAVGQIFGSNSVEMLSKDSVLDHNDSEEKRSSEMFKFRETLPKEQAAFEDRQRDKYQDACEFFEFKTRFGRHPMPEDRGTVELMGEELTRLAGRLFQEKALNDGMLPKPADISKLAYKEFPLRPEIEKTLTEQMAAKHGLSLPTAQIMANLMITQENISEGKITKTDEVKCLDLAKHAEGRMRELMKESAEKNSHKNDSLDQSTDHSHNLSKYRLARELSQMQAHQNRHGVLPTDEALTKIQEKTKVETQKLSEKILTEQTAQLQRNLSVRQGLRM